MNKQNLELLGLSEGATLDEVTAAYDSLREKYLEERFMDGEVGNNAAKMLTKIETAYSELVAEFHESSSADEGGDSFARVEKLIKDGNLQEAQQVLDGFNERGGQWHYLQSRVFYRKNWINESKKQLEIAIQLDPENTLYKETYRKVKESQNEGVSSSSGGGAGEKDETRSAYRGQTMADESDGQMGGNFCANCIECCYCNMLLNCLCSACCR